MVSTSGADGERLYWERLFLYFLHLWASDKGCYSIGMTMDASFRQLRSGFG